VRTGGILAMASYPTYDPSWFVQGLTPKEQHYLGFLCDRKDGCPAAKDRAAQLNRAMQQNYKPGSTFKPFVGLAAVKEGITTLNGSTSCPPTYFAGTDVNQLTPFTNWSSSDLGYMSLAEALRISCDTVFYRFGDLFWQRWHQEFAGANNEPFQRDLKQWSFGHPTGVDLPGETAGVIPDAAFAEAHKDIYHFGWIPGGDILLSIGSGDTLATPLQLADAFSALANGGHVCRPHVVDHITDPDNRRTVKTVTGHCSASQLPYTSQELQYIRAALTTVPESGTASSAFVGFPLSQYPIAGKTGTAERQGTNANGVPFQSTSWFASFAPANHPRYAVVAMVEQGGYGSQTAAPIVRHMYEHIFGLRVTGQISTLGAD
jgi:penicillin-binding protein 2